MASVESNVLKISKDAEDIPLDIEPAALVKLESDLIEKYVKKIQTLLNQKDEEIISLKALIEKLSPRAAENGDKDEKNANQAEIDPVAKLENADADFVNDAFSLVDEMRQAAVLAKNLQDFIYEPTSGLYYDQKTGYYYNAEYGLYYDGNTGCYYKYDEKKDAYEFHSQVQVQPNQKTQNDEPLTEMEEQIEFDEWGGVITDKELLRQIKEEKMRVLEKERKKRKKGKHEKKTKHKHRKHHKHDQNGSNNDVEDGELSSSESSASETEGRDEKDKNKLDDILDDVPMFEKSNKFQAIAKKYPPSLRLIVKETNLENLKVGSLSLITYKGGTLGREGKHDVIIPDANVSKNHLKFSYNDKKSMYQCTDTGSRNGTLLNGQSITVNKKNRSESQIIPHGSIIQISSTKLLCHIHEGNTTCGQCEPGLLMESTVCTSNNTTLQTSLSHKEGLKKLQKRYGLENEKFVESGGNSNYNDRAANRRLHIGSSSDKEKTQVASVNTEISSENKGFKMLSKLGWNKGETLGKDGGLLEPINVVQYEGKQGLGSEVVANSSGNTTMLSKSDKVKLQNLHKTRERFAKTTDMFVEDDAFNMK